jgi:hypothetical protein
MTSEGGGSFIRKTKSYEWVERFKGRRKMVGDDAPSVVSVSGTTEKSTKIFFF